MCEYISESRRVARTQESGWSTYSNSIDINMPNYALSCYIIYKMTNDYAAIL